MFLRRNPSKYALNWFINEIRFYVCLQFCIHLGAYLVHMHQYTISTTKNSSITLFVFSLHLTIFNLLFSSELPFLNRHKNLNFFIISKNSCIILGVFSMPSFISNNFNRIRKKSK